MRLFYVLSGKLAVFCLSVLCVSSMAGASSVSNVTVTRFMMEEAYGELLFIRVDQEFTRPVCSTNTSWQFVLDLSTPYGTKVHSLLLIAYASHRPMKFVGYDTCNPAVGTVEDLKRVEIYE